MVTVSYITVGFQKKVQTIWTLRLTSPGEGNGNPLQYFCLEYPMDGGAY